jgi:hypothetical protein
MEKQSAALQASRGNPKNEIKLDTNYSKFFTFSELPEINSSRFNVGTNPTQSGTNRRGAPNLSGSDFANQYDIKYQQPIFNKFDNMPTTIPELNADGNIYSVEDRVATHFAKEDRVDMDLMDKMRSVN